MLFRAFQNTSRIHKTVTLHMLNHIKLLHSNMGRPNGTNLYVFPPITTLSLAGRGRRLINYESLLNLKNY